MNFKQLYNLQLSIFKSFANIYCVVEKKNNRFWDQNMFRLFNKTIRIRMYHVSSEVIRNVPFRNALLWFDNLTLICGRINAREHVECKTFVHRRPVLIINKRVRNFSRRYGIRTTLRYGRRRIRISRTTCANWSSQLRYFHTATNIKPYTPFSYWGTFNRVFVLITTINT